MSFINEPFELSVRTTVCYQAKFITCVNFNMVSLIFIFEINIIRLGLKEFVDSVNLEAQLRIMTVNVGKKDMNNTDNTANCTSYFPNPDNSSIDSIKVMIQGYPFNENSGVLFLIVNESCSNEPVKLPEVVLISLSKLNPICDIREMAQSKSRVQVLSES